ncbi:MAG TPA: hypothetical protein PKA64_12675, partial [Myxococcota bacterium]|nr:hypothetical protein [Myxococcota bacterium]
MLIDPLRPPSRLARGGPPSTRRRCLLSTAAALALTCPLTAWAAPEIALFDGPDATAPELFDEQPDPVDFGALAPGQVHLHTFTVLNMGDTPLTLSDGTIDGPPEYEMGLLPVTLEPGEQGSFIILFSAGDAGPYDAVLTLSSDDDDEAQLELPLHAEVLPDADGDGVPDDVDLCEGDDASGDPDADGLCSDLDPCWGEGPDDGDGDGVCDDADLCYGDDGAGDIDADGVCGDLDYCPADALDDLDGDGLCGDADNCPDDYNPDQLDLDGDLVGDMCGRADCVFDYATVKVVDRFHRPDGPLGPPWMADTGDPNDIGVFNVSMCSDAGGLALLDRPPGTAVYAFTANIVFAADTDDADELYVIATDAARARPLLLGCDGSTPGGCVLTVDDARSGATITAPFAEMTPGAWYTIDVDYTVGNLTLVLSDADGNELASIYTSLFTGPFDTVGAVVGRVADGARTCVDTYTLTLETVSETCDCADDDADGMCDEIDVCPGAYDPDQADGDDDALGDACDACPADPYNDADADTIC